MASESQGSLNVDNGVKNTSYLSFRHFTGDWEQTDTWHESSSLASHAVIYTCIKQRKEICPFVLVTFLYPLRAGVNENYPR